MKCFRLHFKKVPVRGIEKTIQREKEEEKRKIEVYSFPNDSKEKQVKKAGKNKKANNKHILQVINRKNM